MASHGNALALTEAVGAEEADDAEGGGGDDGEEAWFARVTAELQRTDEGLAAELAGLSEVDVAEYEAAFLADWERVLANTPSAAGMKESVLASTDDGSLVKRAREQEEEEVAMSELQLTMEESEWKCNGCGKINTKKPAAKTDAPDPR